MNRLLPIALPALLLPAVLNAQSVEQKLKWVRETIDAHAVTRHFEPPARSSGTKWEVTKIEGCAVELKQTTHRESPDSVLTAEGFLDLSEGKVSTWTFDLSNLRPQFIMADTVGGPHVSFFAQGDAFHFNTETVSRTLRKDGTTVSTSTWSAPGSASNLWIYFDSPAADNNQLIRKVEFDLRSAAQQCAVQTGAR